MRSMTCSIVRPRASPGAAAQFIRDVAVPFTGDACLPWPFAASRGVGRVKVCGKAQIAHRVVCKAAHGEPPTPAHAAAHSCGNGHTGCVNPRHLRWATHTENEADKLLHGTTARGEGHGRSKLTEEDVHTIRAKLAAGQKQADIPAEHGVHRVNVSHIKTGKSWVWLTTQYAASL